MISLNMKAVVVVFLICFAVFLSTSVGAAQVPQTLDWRTHNLSFRVLNTTSVGSSLWICGTDETLAVSSDAGEHWQVKHQTLDGAVPLNVDFANEKFGFAAGTGGLLLATEDGGETWVPHSGSKDAILQISFSDPKHGLIRTLSSLLFTGDGSASWQVVSAGQNTDDIKHFPYTFSLVALDSVHMAVMMKEGSAQYQGQRFLVTDDSGKSWKFVAIPNTTLYSFLRVDGKYWTVGTEVIHKDQPGGGYGVPVALYSSDGEQWEHSSHDLSACKLHMCVGCTTKGCLSANGTISDFFSDKTSYKEFSPDSSLTSRWSATASAVCFVGKGLRCAGLKSVDKPGSSEGSLPVAVGPKPLGGPATQGPQCLVCGLDGILIDNKAQGSYTIKLTLDIGRNGVVRSAAAEGALRHRRSSLRSNKRLRNGYSSHI